MKRWLWMCLLALVLAGTSGCIFRGTDVDAECTPGAARQCSCPNGDTGTRRCRDDGSGFGKCLCGGTDTSMDTAPRDTGPFDTADTRPDDTGSPDTGAVDTRTADGDEPSDGSTDGGGRDADTASPDTGGSPPELVVDGRVTFSDVDPDTRASDRLAVRNGGDSPLTLERIELKNGGPFTVKKAADQGSSSGGGSKGTGPSNDTAPVPGSDDPVADLEGTSLAAGESVDLRIYFEPSDNQPTEAELKIESDAPDASSATVALTGNLDAPCLAVSSGDELTFGKSSTGRTTKSTVTLENCRPRAGDLDLQTVELTDDADEAFELVVPGRVTDGNGYTFSGDERVNFLVLFKPNDNRRYTGTLLLESNDPARRQFRIELSGRGTSNECPNAIAKASISGSSGSPSTQLTTTPLETVQLDGSESTDSDGRVTRYAWTILDRPNDSTARLTPNSSVEKPTLFLDLAGTYILELVVYDDDGIRSCGRRGFVEITVEPSEEIHVQLVWTTPADGDPTDDNGSDLDLHYLNSRGTWNKAPWDIFWDNKTADWGNRNDTSDDPVLDVDDTTGAGPETVNHANPATGKTYTVGVHYYDDHGFGPAYATVRIYVDGRLEQELEDKYLSGTSTFWKVALIEWPSQNVYKRDQIIQGIP